MSAPSSPLMQPISLSPKAWDLLTDKSRLFFPHDRSFYQQDPNTIQCVVCEQIIKRAATGFQYKVHASRDKLCQVRKQTANQVAAAVIEPSRVHADLRRTMSPPEPSSSSPSQRGPASFTVPAASTSSPPMTDTAQGRAKLQVVGNADAGPSHSQPRESSDNRAVLVPFSLWQL